MKIDNVRVYGLEESIIASGYPMQVDTDNNFDYQVENLSYWINNGLLEYALQQENKTWQKNYNRLSMNKIKLYKDYATIITNDNDGIITGEFEVDYDDLEEIIKYKWTLSNGYAMNHTNGISLHRFIAKPNDTDCVDHIDKNTKNNRKINLRITDIKNNARNCNVSKNSSSGVIGVSYRSDRNKWRAYITIDRKQITLGHYETKDLAIFARLNGEVEYFGEYAPQQHLFEQYGLKRVKPSNIKTTDIKPNLFEAIKHYKRICKLGRVDGGTGHDSALKGIIVQADITAPQYFWLQWERYHFQDTISSQSTMHRITRMDLESQMNQYVLPIQVSTLNKLIDAYNTYSKEDYTFGIEIEYFPMYKLKVHSKQELFQYIISNTPEGIELTRRVTLNYLQLKSMYSQRKNHKLEEWREIFCPWILTLPHFEELVLNKQ